MQRSASRPTCGPISSSGSAESKIEADLDGEMAEGELSPGRLGGYR